MLSSPSLSVCVCECVSVKDLCWLVKSVTVNFECAILPPEICGLRQSEWFMQWAQKDESCTFSYFNCFALLILLGQAAPARLPRLASSGLAFYNILLVIIIYFFRSLPLFHSLPPAFYLWATLLWVFWSARPSPRHSWLGCLPGICLVVNVNVCWENFTNFITSCGLCFVLRFQFLHVTPSLRRPCVAWPDVCVGFSFFSRAFFLLVSAYFVEK